MAKKQKNPDKLTNRQLEIIVRNGEDFFDKEYIQYCIYVLEQRALPSIIDGLKPGARKIIHAGFHILSETKKTNFMDLVGTTMSYAKYHHGDMALLGTIKTLGTEYTDTLAPLSIIGSNGDLRSPEGAAGRYLHVKLSSYAKILKKNSEILEYNYDGSTKVEPKYYLPIIPLVLSSRTTGLGVGFSFNLHVSYNPVSIIDQCLSVLKDGIMMNKLVPHINQFYGSFHEDAKGRIYASGKYKVTGKNIQVTEFAPNVTFEQFEKNLDALYDKGLIVKYENNSEDSIHYDLVMSASFFDKHKTSASIEKALLLSQVLKSPTLTVLNEHGKLTEFDDVEEILEYFVEFREKQYAILKDSIIKSLKEKIESSELMRKFIDLFLSGKIVISKDVSIAETIKQMLSYNIPEEYINTRISKLTKDEYEKLGNEIVELKTELKVTIETEPKTMYVNDLEDLRTDLVKDFPLSKFTFDE